MRSRDAHLARAIATWCSTSRTSSSSHVTASWRCGASRALGKEVQVFTSGAVVCRPTQQEADEYFHYFAVERRDDGAIDTMLNFSLSPVNQRAMTRAEAEQLHAR